MADHLHIDTACGVTEEALLGALVDLGAPRAAVEQAWAAVAEATSLALMFDGGLGLSGKGVGDSRTPIAVADATSLLARADVPPGLRSRAQAALAAWHETATPRAPMSHEELGWILAVSAAVEALRPLAITTGPLPLPHYRPEQDPAPVLTRLRGALVRVTDLPAEAVTPLGVVLVRSLAEPEAAPPVFELTGRGTGYDAAGIPRVRVLAGQPEMEAAGSEHLVLLETNLDDVQPELLATLIPSCLEAGAVDAWLTPVLMKKGRPAHVLSALCHTAAWPSIEELLFRETTTLGVRRSQVARSVLDRRLHRVETPWGAVRVKLGMYRNLPVNCAPEFEDCLQVAAAAQVPVKQVYAAALAKGNALFLYGKTCPPFQSQ